MEYLPSKGCAECERGIQSRIRIRARGCSDTATAAKAVQSIEKTWTHEAHNAQHSDLRIWVRVYASETLGALINLSMPRPVVFVATTVTVILFLGHGDYT